MPRSVRITFADAYYHVMARCNRRGEIFLDDDESLLSIDARRSLWNDRVGHPWSSVVEAPLVKGGRKLRRHYARQFMELTEKI